MLQVSTYPKPPFSYRLLQASNAKCEYRVQTNIYMTIYNLLHISDMFGTMGTVLRHDDDDDDNNGDDDNDINNNNNNNCYHLYKGYLQLYT